MCNCKKKREKRRECDAEFITVMEKHLEKLRADSKNEVCSSIRYECGLRADGFELALGYFKYYFHARHPLGLRHIGKWG
jgi:hypothetical protein